MKKFLALGLVITFLISSCSTVQNANNKQKGAVLGAAAGGVLGAVLGNNLGDGENSELGAIIGVVVGGVAGGIIGNKMDKQAKEIETEVPGAEVTMINDGQAIEVTFSDDDKNGVVFATGKSTLNQNSKNTLDKLEKIFETYGDTQIEIHGHTDSDGSEENNLALSKRRTDAVTNYLIEKGITKERIAEKWFGETKPKYPNDSAENKAKNRRVELFIVPNKKMIEEAQKEAGQN